MTSTPPAQSVIHLHNDGAAAVQVTSLDLSGANSALFHVETTLPATIMPGMDLPVTVDMTTTGATLPAMPPGPAPYNAGSNLLTATLTAASSSGSVEAKVYGLLLVANPNAGAGSASNYEPTLGQILTTLGYDLNVGPAQTDWNPNTSMIATNLPGFEANTDEVLAPRFVKAGANNVTLTVVARFSPIGELPYGYYTPGNPNMRTTVGTMAMSPTATPDLQTSSKARMVYPPLDPGSMTTFDPGAAPFAIWVYSDQKTQKFKEGGTMSNGDYDYSEDAQNSPAVHRMRSYPLKDATGTVVPQTYLIAVEEAANGDYQDYVFVLGNVNVSP